MGLVWRRKKKRAEESYSFLVDNFMGDYGKALQSLSHLADIRFQVDKTVAWVISLTILTYISKFLNHWFRNAWPQKSAANIFLRMWSGESRMKTLILMGFAAVCENIKSGPLSLLSIKSVLSSVMKWVSGKTVQAIAVAVALRNAGAQRCLVVCPASVLENWCREVSSKSDLKCLKLYGDEFCGNASRWVESGGVAITTYESLKRLRLSNDGRIDLLVVDEAHYIKHKSSLRSARVRSLCLQSERVMLMTGTALENNANEMVSLIDSVRPDIALEAQKHTSMESSATYRKIVAPVYLRRRREDVLSELPQLIEQKEWCSLSESDLQSYEKAVELRDVAMMKRVSWCTDDLSESSKANRAKEIVDQAREEGRKTIIFSFYLKTLTQVRDLFGNACFGPITGAVSPRERQQVVDDFNNAPAGSVLVSQIQAGGVGLNIQSASVVILCEPQLKPSTENQAISRAYRMGQVRNVLVYRLLAMESIDERIDDLLRQKKIEFDLFADSSDSSDESFELNDLHLNELIEDEVERIRAIRSMGGSKAARYALASEGVGCSASQRAKAVPQPEGGYLSPRVMNVSRMTDDTFELRQGENISANLIGMAVDYLTRFMIGDSVEKAFSISLRERA